MQRLVKILELYRNTQLGKTGHGIFADATGNDAAKMAEIGVYIDRESMHRDPFPDANSNRANLGFLPVRSVAPDSNPAIHGPRHDPEFSKRGFHPMLQRVNKAAHIRVACLQIQNDIADPLPRTVIGMPATPARIIDWKFLTEQFRRIGTVSRSVEWWMLKQPDQLPGIAGLNRGIALFHFGERFGISDRFRGEAPFNVIASYHRNFVHFCWPGGKGKQSRNGFGNEKMKLNYMQCWNGAMALLGAHKEAILAISGVFIFLPTLLFAQYVVPPVINGDEDMNALVAIYSAYFNENAFSILASNLATSFGGLAIYFALAPSRHSTVAEDLIAALKIFVIYLLANLLIALVSLPGFLLFIVPGLYLTCRFIVVPVVLADQGERNPVELLKRSWSVTRNNGFSILLFILIIAVVGTITIGVLEAVTGVIAGLATAGTGWPFVENLVAALTGTAFQLVLTAVIVSIYIELTGKQADVGAVTT